MKDIAIYGAGGLGREVACMLKKLNEIELEWNLIGFFDDGKTVGQDVFHFGKILGGIEELNNWSTPLCVALCFGTPKTLCLIRSKITNPNISFPNLIDSSFIVEDKENFVIGEGNIIKKDCLLTTNVSIGSFNLFNGFVVVGHDTKIGDYNVFMPSTRISGEVTIGNCNLFGAISFVKQQLKIGNDVTLSPLSALLIKPKDASIYIGNPARKFNF